MRAVVIYCSRKGNTERLARKIKADTFADSIKVEPFKKYGNYISSIVRVRKEISEDVPVEFKNSIPDLKEYDVIFLGFPIWYSQMPPFIENFMSKCDVKDKLVIPFSTSTSTSINSALDDVKRCCKGAKMAEPYSRSFMRQDDYNEWIENIKAYLMH